MSDQTTAQGFADALQQFESSGDGAPLFGLFADGAELQRPEVDKAGSSGGDVEGYWSAYRDQFGEISTEFSAVDQSGDLAVLEWSSRGTLSTGRDIAYAGVSLLRLDGDGKVSRFSTYYDTAAFLEPTAS